MNSPCGFFYPTDRKSKSPLVQGIIVEYTSSCLYDPNVNKSCWYQTRLKKKAPHPIECGCLLLHLGLGQQVLGHGVKDNLNKDTLEALVRLGPKRTGKCAEKNAILVSLPSGLFYYIKSTCNDMFYSSKSLIQILGQHLGYFNTLSRYK